MRPIKVALVSTAKDWHGGEQQAFLLAQGLRQQGHDCRILARRGAAFGRRLKEAGFAVTTFFGKGWNPLAQWRMRTCWRNWQPNILHFNDSHALTTGGCAAWRLHQPVRIVSRRGSAPPHSVWRYHHLADQVVCVSRAAARACVAAGIDTRRLGVVYDGVDPRRMAAGNRDRGRRSLKINAGTKLVVCVASLTSPKGHRCLLDAWSRVVGNHCNDQVTTETRNSAQLVLVGDGPLRTQLTQQAEALRIRKTIRFLGYRQDVPDLIQAADVCTLASHQEGLGSSLIDAMLAGRPVVTTTAGGIPELLGNTSSPIAWAVKPNDAAALASALHTALHSTALAAQRSACARRRAMQHFTADQMVNQTLELYEQSLAVRETFTRRARIPVGVIDKSTNRPHPVRLGI
ncbi:MAG: hypothetical protein CMJ75_03985 [Planctomycetaceae bacterium]|nr:hypothetical protein [Planctomycetaceae bacterium]